MNLCSNFPPEPSTPIVTIALCHIGLSDVPGLFFLRTSHVAFRAAGGPLEGALVPSWCLPSMPAWAPTVPSCFPSPCLPLPWCIHSFCGHTPSGDFLRKGVWKILFIPRLCIFGHLNGSRNRGCRLFPCQSCPHVMWALAWPLGAQCCPPSSLSNVA